MSKKTTTAKSAPKAAKGFVNPYREGGNYHAIVGTLEVMGKDKAHAYEAFAKKLKSEWDGWTNFTRKEVRNEATHKDANGKLLVNCKVVQRKDYGAGLHEQGACVDMFYEKGTLMIRLNTKSASPISAGRQPKPQTVKAAPKAAKAVKVKTKAKNAPSKSASPILEGREAIAALKNAK